MSQALFLFFNLLATPVVILAIYDIVILFDGVRTESEIIPLDTGSQYLFLISIFWILSCLQYASLRGCASFVKQWGSKIVITWFIACLVVASLMPMSLRSMLEKAGYKPCQDTVYVSPISRGEKLIYVKNFCPSHEESSLSPNQ